MRKILKARVRSGAFNARKGLAPIEFLCVLPMILAIIVFIFWVYRTRDATLRAGMRAEFETIQEVALSRSLADLHSTETLNVGSSNNFDRLVQAFDSSLSIGAGWVGSSVVESTGEGVHGVTAPAGDVTEAHGTLSNAFGDGVLYFPQSSSEQPPLTLPAGAQGIAPGVGSFSQLLGF